MTKDSILDASKYSQQNPSKSSKTLKLVVTESKKRTKIAFFANFDLFLGISLIYTYLAQTPEIGQGLGRFLSRGPRKQEQT